MQLSASQACSVVVYGDDPCLQFAGEELCRHLGRVVGCRGSITIQPRLAADPAIQLVHAASDGADVLPSERRQAEDIGSTDERESYVIDIRETSVRFAGSRPRAVLYAVYDLLREELGCAFALPDAGGDDPLPSRPSVALPISIRREQADFACRGNGFHGDGARPAADYIRWIDWMAKMRFNRVQLQVGQWESLASALQPEMVRRDLDLDLGIHGLNYFLAESKYFGDHPDWYASVENRWGRQIRFSNCASIATVAENILAFLKRHPGVAWLGLWPLDGTAFDPGDVASGRMSDLVMHYVNRVAERVGAVLPELRFDHLAYIGYAAPPLQTRPRAGITTSFCHYWDRNFTRPIYDAWYGRKRFAGPDMLEKGDRAFHPMRHHRDCCEQLVGWLELGRTIVFCYYADLNLSAQNVFDLPPLIRKDLQYYRALGVDGLMNCYCFQEEIPWFYRDLHALADLMWDVDRDWKPREMALLKTVFGAAASAMERFYASLNALQNEPLWCGCSLADLFRGLLPAYELAGYLPRLHAPTLAQIDARFAVTLASLDEALPLAGGAGIVRDRLAGIRLNVVHQHVFARLGCQVLLAFHYGHAGREGRLDRREACAKGLAALAEALRGFNEWTAVYAVAKPAWVHLERKIQAYRAALETDFPGMIRSLIDEERNSTCM